MTDHMKRRGLLIILSSPSGAGKSTLARRLLKDDAEISFSVSATTRPPRPGEVDGKDYHFTSRAAFENLVEKGEMLEHAEVFGNFYGSPLEPVEQATKAGRDILFDIDWQGGQQIRASSLGDYVLSIFILPPSTKELHMRLVGRGHDSAEVIAGRMAKAQAEISHWPEYDYVLVNDDVEECVGQIKTIIAAERLRRDRQPWLVDLVRKMNAECEDLT